MKKQFILIPLILLVISNSCVNKDNFLGIYVSPNLKRNVDTLYLYENGTYNRKLYNKISKKIVLSQDGKWKMSKGNIILYNFHIDEDNVYSIDRKFDTGLVNVYLSTNISFFETRLNYGQIEGRFYYKKIK